MRKLSACFFALLGACVLSAAANEFESANALYDEGKFPEAQRLYEGLVARGERSADVFYNLGNTHFRQNAIGPAIASYERALLLDPAHPEAIANRRWVRERSGAKVAAAPVFASAIPPVTTNTLAIAASVALWLAIFAVVGWRAWGLGACALLVSAYCALGLWLRTEDAHLAIIVAPEAVARLAPADRAAVAEALPAGSRVRVLSERGVWFYCALPGGGRGWIPEKELEKLLLPSA